MSARPVPRRSGRVGQYLTLREAADRLAVSVKTIRRLIDRGELPAVRIGGSLRIEEAGLLAYLDRNRVRPMRVPGAPPAWASGRRGVARAAMREHARDGDRGPLR